MQHTPAPRQPHTPIELQNPLAHSWLCVHGSPSANRPHRPLGRQISSQQSTSSAQGRSVSLQGFPVVGWAIELLAGSVVELPGGSDVELPGGSVVGVLGWTVVGVLGSFVVFDGSWRSPHASSPLIPTPHHHNVHLMRPE